MYMYIYSSDSVTFSFSVFRYYAPIFCRLVITPMIERHDPGEK